MKKGVWGILSTARIGSYEELLADPKSEAIYDPLPNHLHAHHLRDL